MGHPERQNCNTKRRACSSSVLTRAAARDARRAARGAGSSVALRKDVSCGALGNPLRILARTRAARGASRVSSLAALRSVMRLGAVEDSVGNPRDLDHFRDVVRANDVRAAQDRRRHGCGRAPEPLVHRRQIFLARLSLTDLRPAD